MEDGNNMRNGYPSRRWTREPDAATDDCARRVIGAAIAVHTQLGPGFLENTYEAALAIELEQREIRFERQVPIVIHYNDLPVGEYRLDFLVEKLVVIELKAAAEVALIHVAQVRAYLAATNLELGLVLNFNVRQLREGGIKRVVRTGSAPT